MVTAEFMKNGLTLKRADPLFQFIRYTLDGDTSKITNEMKPKNEKEEKWVEKNLKRILERKKDKDYDIKERKALEECEKVLREYLPKEYWSDGFFNTNKFDSLQRKLYRKILKDLDKMIALKEEPLYSKLVVCGKIPDEIQIRYMDSELKKILKEEYNIDWNPIYEIAPKPYFDDIKRVKEKYKKNLYWSHY